MQISQLGVVLIRVAAPGEGKGSDDSGLGSRLSTESYQRR